MIRLIDIEKELRSIKTEYKPDEGLRQRTRYLVKKEAQKKNRSAAPLRRAVFVYSPIVAVILAAVLCISMFTATPARAAGYYTIDINPSVSVAVDQNNVVLSVTPEDEDAVVMLEGMDIEGMQFEDALKTILQAAAQKNYLKDSGHVLVAYFGDGEGITQDDISSIVDEMVPAEKINTLALTGSKDDYNNAKKSGKKAGIELLLDNADAAGIEESDPDTVINIMSDKLKNGKDNSGNNGNKDNNGTASPSPNNSNNGEGQDKDKDKDVKTVKPTKTAKATMSTRTTKPTK